MERFGQASTEYIIVLGVLLAVGLAAVAIVSMNYQGQADNDEAIGNIKEKQQPLRIDVVEAYLIQPDDPPPYDYYLYLELTNHDQYDIALRSLIINASKPNGNITLRSSYWQGTEMFDDPPDVYWQYNPAPLSDIRLKPGETLCFGHDDLFAPVWPTKRQPNCPQRAIAVGTYWNGTESLPGLSGDCAEDATGSFVIPDAAIEYTLIADSYEIVKRSYYGDIPVKCYGSVPL